MCVCKAQLQKFQDDVENLREQKDSAILSMHQELQAAQDEVQVFRQAMEKTVADGEHEVSTLKSKLTALTTELEKWQSAAEKYEQEIDNLRANQQQQNQQRDQTAKQQGTKMLTSASFKLNE